MSVAVALVRRPGSSGESEQGGGQHDDRGNEDGYLQIVLGDDLPPADTLARIRAE